ncbi:NHLP bacteriocin system secretion protein [Spiribacter sp. C176]|uniref:NHLP bacteriocin system secretion protein n=1 Tax=Spiribacter salilacus TaxID=2664894 RepID=A0A6N7QTE9_9GAMM|nr:NHLP bacteriocin system secretion protein [Spiribacter salilacus]MRH77587.1 NHLP bacteriocin system secretion protein [Spiribacter salilacus]
MPKSGIFRQQALDQLSAPEQLDAMMVATSRRGWVALTAVLLLLTSVVLWGFYGVVPTRLDGEGVFIRTGGVEAVTVTTAGRISELELSAGDEVEQGQVIARLAQPELRAELRVQQTRVDALTDRLEQLRRHQARQADLQAAFSEQRQTNLEDLLAINEERYAMQSDLEAKGLIPRRNRIETAEAIANTKADLKELALNNAQQAQERANRIETAQLELDQARAELEGIAARYRVAVEVLAPQAGRVVELKYNVGASVSAGAEILSLERSGRDINALEVAMFLPAKDGKQLNPGMTALVSPTIVEREEHGYLVGKITWVSEFPATFNGMMRLLDNESLVRQLMREGAVFEASVNLIRDAHTPSGYRWTSGQGPEMQIRTGGLAETRVTVAERRPITLVIPTLRRWLGL